MNELSFGLLAVLTLILLAEFVNGATDAPNAIATAVSTRVLTPTQAIIMAAVLNAAGAFSGTAVAATIGKGIVKSEAINLATVGAAMIAIVLWSGFTWRFGGIPTSESHALIAGLTGASLATAGPSVLIADGWTKIGMGMIFSTLFGFGGGLVLITIIYWIFHRVATRDVQNLFGKLQVFSAAFMAYSHGSNDGQKFIGAFTLALVLGGTLPQFQVPFWVILICSMIMGIGTSVGGWRIIRTMGIKMVHLERHQGFAAETSAAFTIELASQLGIPLSTTHTITTAIMGVGAARRVSAVRWRVVQEIVIAWILTFPICGTIGWLVATIMNLLAQLR